MIVLIVFAVLLALILYFVCPRIRSRAKPFHGVFFHRGRFGGDIKENTAGAFAAAVDAGYGFEFDVRLSADGKTYISHDDSLKRVFGVDKKVSETSSAELSEIGVPSLEETLSIAGGMVPLIVEIKGEDKNTEVCRAACDILKGYSGPFCVESFNPFYMKYVRRNYPEIIRGQLSHHFGKQAKPSLTVGCFFLTNLFADFMSRPDFIAYDWTRHGSFFLNLCGVLGAVKVGWSPRGNKQIEEAKKYFDTVIVEDYDI
ncbi:MAG: hypothetical protein KBT31_01670 [Firmicutes bacterium]|nr:hypothetical protein [Candidatus Colimorpha enterica]